MNPIEMFFLQVEFAIVVSFVPNFEVLMCDELLQLYLLHSLFESSSGYDFKSSNFNIHLYLLEIVFLNFFLTTRIHELYS